MTTTTKPATLAQALVDFHKEAPTIVKDSVNPHFKSKFASLDSVMDAIRPVLSKHGLAVAQLPTTIDGQPALRTILLHQTGETLEDTMLLFVDKPGPQAQGAALTYARRYAVQAILGLVADEDDDGNAAQAAQEKAGKAAPEFKAPVRNGKPTAEQEAQIADLTARLMGGGHMTQEQLDSAAMSSSPVELLARLTRYAEMVQA